MKPEQLDEMYVRVTAALKHGSPEKWLVCPSDEAREVADKFFVEKGFATRCFDGGSRESRRVYWLGVKHRVRTRRSA